MDTISNRRAVTEILTTIRMGFLLLVLSCYAGSMEAFATTAEAVAATTKKTEKVRLVAEYFRSRPVDEAPRRPSFSPDGPFLRGKREHCRLAVRCCGEPWARSREGRHCAYCGLSAAWRPGGGGAGRSGAHGAVPELPIIAEIAAAFDELARTSTPLRKLSLLQDLLRRATALEAKYIIKIISGDLRIGLRESLVEEAIAKAFDEKLADVQRANMLLGDITGALRLAAEHKLNQAQMRLFHPIGFMLASPAQDAQEALSYFARAAVEDKYDGIRAQAHAGGKEDPRVRLFSRTLDEISRSFPELPLALRAFPGTADSGWRNPGLEPAHGAGAAFFRAAKAAGPQNRL